MKKNFICLSLMGGIGDQIFQYCYANYLRTKFRCDTYLDTSYYNNKKNFNNFKFRINNLTKKTEQLTKTEKLIRLQAWFRMYPIHRRY